MRRNPKRATFLPTGLPFLSLMLLVAALAATGCSADNPAPASSSAEANPPGSAGTPRGVGPSTPGESPVPTAVAAADGPAGNPGPADPTAIKPGPVKPPVPATPTAEHLARWGLSEEPPIELLACYDGFSDPFVNCMAIAPDGKEFCLGGARITLWNPAESKPTADLLENVANRDIERPILAVGISPDGRWLAAGDSGGKLRIWNRSDRSEVAVVQAHEGRLTELAFSPDSKTLATTSYSGEVRLFGVDGMKLKSLEIDKQEIRSLAFCSDRLLATAGQEAAVWDLEAGTKVATLTTGRLIGPALGLSADRRFLAFADSDGKTKLWDARLKGSTPALIHTAAHRIEFSKDGRRIATGSGDRTLRIWDGRKRTIRQVIDADGGRTAAFAWLPDSHALVVVTGEGCVRIWGTADDAKALGITSLAPIEIRATPVAAKRSASPAELERVIDVRSFPRLPDAVPTFSYGGSETYTTAAPQDEVELFYRHVLGKSGWAELPATDPTRPGLNFQKDGCALNLSITPASPPMPGHDGDRQVTLLFSGNYDARWLPKVSAIESPSAFGSFSLISWRTRASITDLEVALLRQFRDAGWTPYSRLASSYSEEAGSRSFTMLQGGSVMTVSIGAPSDAAGELFVQAGVQVSNKSLPIPADASWIEFDSSTDLRLVATTRMTVAETVAFFDTEMPQQGWLGREAGRKVDEKRGWLPYIRGQRDVLIRLTALPAETEGSGDAGGNEEARGTRILVGDAEKTSWQLKPKAAAKEPAAGGGAGAVGIEAADLSLPKGAGKLHFDIDNKQIEFEVADVLPQKVAEQFAKQMEELGWKRDGAGILSDDYVFLTYEKGKSEIQLRGRGVGKNATAMISGDGLLWTKPLPAAPVRISYETWLRRNGKTASLDHLDDFAAEMEKIPAGISAPMK